LVGNTGVLRITTFNDQTYPGVQSGIKKLVEEAGGMDKINGFVIDLRNNPGGLLKQAILTADAFLNEGEIVSTRGRDAKDSSRENATPGDLAMGKPLVVLINGGSASASEIVTGALQDHRRAIVVGTKSFGKGSVQTLIPLKGEGAMRLTTARYYTPSGRSIQSLGVMPDIVVNQPVVDPNTKGTEAAAADKEGKQRTEASLPGAISNDSMTEDEKKQLEEDRARVEEAAKLRDEDYQLAYAVDILRGLSAVAPKQ
jgi:carboxyl-terminal processing protease